MFPVSEEFLTTISKNTRHYYWTGSMKTTQNVVYEFASEQIIKGSGYITRQCSGSSEIEIGTVYASELGITLLLEVDRYTLDNAEIKMFFHLILDDGTEEIVPMGIFEVSEANRHIKTLELKAYDYMLRFDETLTVTSSTGTAYDYLNLACTECKVELAQTKEELQSFPNGKTSLGIYSENDIESYRDLIYYVSQVLGCVCQINREGKLEILPFGTSPIAEIPTEQRFSSSYSDFVTSYTAVSFTNLVTETTEYYCLDTDDGLTIALGTNPFIQYGVDSTRKQIFENILEAIAVIKYTPFDSTVIGNPALDPMDVLTFSGGHADESQISCITNITYKIGGKQTLKCVGKNPKLASAKSKLAKEISGLLGTSTSDSVVYYNFVNVSPFSIESYPIEIISIDFTSTKAVTVLFQSTILFEVINTDNTSEVTIIYKLNHVEMETFMPVKTCFSGKDFFTLYLPFPEIEANTSNTFSVSLKIVGGVVEIGEGQIKATVSGQGLVAGVGEWDGRIEVTDYISEFSVHSDFGVSGFTDSVEITLREDIRRNPVEIISLVPLDTEIIVVNGIDNSGFSEYVPPTFDGEFGHFGIVDKLEIITKETEKAEITDNFEEISIESDRMEVN